MVNELDGFKEEATGFLASVSGTQYVTPRKLRRGSPLSDFVCAVPVDMSLHKAVSTCNMLYPCADSRVENLGSKLKKRVRQCMTFFPFQQYQKSVRNITNV